jgi:hypothetical protein
MKLTLNLTTPAGACRVLEYAAPEILIGRDPSCDLAFEGDAAQTVSWNHVKIELTPMQARVIDLGSSNGTFVDDRRIESAVPLRVGQVIALGQTGPRLKVIRLDLADVSVSPAHAIAREPAPERAAVLAASAPFPATFDLGDRGSATKPPSPTRMMLVQMQTGQRKLWLATAIGAACLALIAGLIAVALFRKGSKLESQVGQHEERLDKVEDAAVDFIARLDRTDARVTDLADAQKATQQQLSALAAAEAAFERRVSQTLADKDRVKHAFAAGMTLRGVLDQLGQLFPEISILLDEPSFAEQGIADIGQRKLVQGVPALPQQPLSVVLQRLLDALELLYPSGSVARDARPQHALVEMLVVLEAGRGQAVKPKWRKQSSGVLIYAGEATDRSPRPIAAMDGAAWSQPVPAWAKTRGGKRQRIELIQFEHPQVRARQDSRVFGEPAFGGLLSVSFGKLHVRFPTGDRTATPFPWDFNTVQWLRTPDNYYLYNEHANAFYPLFTTHYRYDRGQRRFLRVASLGGVTANPLDRLDSMVFMSEGAWLHGLTTVAGGGELDLGLSLPVDGPPELEPKHFPIIICQHRKFRYEESKGIYVYLDPVVEERERMLQALDHLLQVLDRTEQMSGKLADMRVNAGIVQGRVSPHDAAQFRRAVNLRAAYELQQRELAATLKP